MNYIAMKFYKKIPNMKPLLIVTLLFLFVSCKKKTENKTEVPITPAVDTAALLTAHQWHKYGRGFDLDHDGTMDTSLISLEYELELYTFTADGGACDTIFQNDTFFYRCGTWHFPNPNKKRFYADFDTFATCVFQIEQITDTTMITYSIGEPELGWLLYRKYTR